MGNKQSTPKTLKAAQPYTCQFGYHSSSGRIILLWQRVIMSPELARGNPCDLAAYCVRCSFAPLYHSAHVPPQGSLLPGYAFGLADGGLRWRIGEATRWDHLLLSFTARTPASGALELVPDLPQRRHPSPSGENEKIAVWAVRHRVRFQSALGQAVSATYLLRPRACPHGRSDSLQVAHHGSKVPLPSSY